MLEHRYNEASLIVDVCIIRIDDIYNGCGKE